MAAEPLVSEGLLVAFGQGGTPDGQLSEWRRERLRLHVCCASGDGQL